MNQTKINFWLDDDFLAKLREAAKKKKISLSALIRMWLNDKLENDK